MRGLMLQGTLTIVAACQPFPTPLPVPPGQPPPPAPPVRSVTLTASGGQAVIDFRSDAAGEVLLSATGSATGVSWESATATSAVVSMFVDGRHVTDDVVMSAEPVTRRFFLGRLAAGPHTLRLLYAADRSPAKAARVTLSGIRFQTITPGDPAYAAVAHAPVLHGRVVTSTLPGAPEAPFQNAVTDTPLLAWHTEAAGSAPGRRRLEYTVLWSGEDGGTAAPALMALWGRTTDIEWIYRVEVDAAGAAVPGTAAFQAPKHADTVFRGRYEGSHPVLGTCTLNNNVCDGVEAPMRFTLAPADRLDPRTQARELMMDRNPWTYQIMAAELRRERRTAGSPIPFVQIHDPRDHLYLVVDKRTVGGPANTDAAWVGLAVGVRLAGDWWLHRSDQVMSVLAVPGWSVRRDGPVATAVRLPAGKTVDDVVAVEAIRVVGAGADTGASVEVLGVARAFMLDRAGLPGPALGPGRFTTPVRLTRAAPTARIFPAPPS
jgi:hypothetical protein